VAAGVNGLTSVAFFLAFSALGTFFVLKDAPVMARFTNTHMGLPVHVASTVTSEIATALRNYFTGVTIIAALTASSSASARSSSACRWQAPSPSSRS
jgi:predicted PurR-regulated permease PerM